MINRIKTKLKNTNLFSSFFNKKIDNKKEYINYNEERIYENKINNLNKKDNKSFKRFFNFSKTNNSNTNFDGNCSLYDTFSSTTSFSTNID